MLPEVLQHADAPERLLLGEEDVDDVGVEVGAALRGDDLHRLLVGDRILVGALAGEGVVHVGQRHDARRERDLVAAPAGGVARAVPALVVVEGDLLAEGEEAPTVISWSIERSASPPSAACCLIFSYSSGLSLPGFSRMASSMPTLPTSCSTEERQRSSM